MKSRHDNDRATNVSDIWNRCKKKAIIFIESGEEFHQLRSDGGLQSINGMNLECRVVFSSGQKQRKTLPALVENGAATWNEALFLDLDGVDTSEEIVLEVVEQRQKSMAKTNVIGTASLTPIDFLAPEVGMTNKAIIIHTKGKRGSKKFIQKTTGSINVWVYFSEQGETTGKPPENQYYYYGDIRNTIKTGDLVFYTEIGLMSALTKLASRGMNNRAGLIVELPNKYTGELEPYVFEITRNNEKYSDAFTEKPERGPTLFRLWERVHHVPGQDVFYVPLNQPLNPDMQGNMLDWIMKVHNGQTDITSLYRPVESFVVKLLETFSIVLDKSPKVLDEFKEYRSTDIIVEALRMGGIRITDQEHTTHVEEILTTVTTSYGDPIPIRVSAKLSSREKAQPQK